MTEENSGGNPTRWSRRRLLGASGAAGLAAAGATAGFGQSAYGAGRGVMPAGNSARVAAPPAEGVLGANFNGDPGKLTFDELADVDATWLRGFFPMPDADKGPIAEKPQIKRLLDARGRGYGTILSLKFPYKKNPVPTPGSAAWETALARLAKVLPVVMGKVDILVVGNEPFIESLPAERDRRLNVFYEELARRVIAYREQHGATGTRLYMGALNALDRGGQTPATDRWVRFVKETEALDGVDIHPHVTSLDAAQVFIDYVLCRMRPEQKFLATEFSLVRLWKDHLTDPVAPEFAACYGDARGKQVWEVVRAATERRFTQQKWDDFLSMHSWFADNETFLQDQVGRFRSTGRLAVATYGVVQDAAMASDFTETSDPWLLNSLFCPYTVQPGEDGLPGRNRAWIRGFRALQQR